MSKRYEATRGVRYPDSADKRQAAIDGELTSADYTQVAAGEEVDEYAVRQSPWLLDKGKVEALATGSLVVSAEMKEKIAPKSKAVSP